MQTSLSKNPSFNLTLGWKKFLTQTIKCVKLFLKGGDKKLRFGVETLKKVLDMELKICYTV
jgi:hypothetical protein